MVQDGDDGGSLMGAPVDSGHDLWPRRPDEPRGQPEVLELVVEQPEQATATRGWTGPAALAAAVLLDAAILWLVRNQLTTLSPIQAVQIATALCVVPALVGIVWLLAQRTSRAEAHRFGQTSRAMRAEAAALEDRIATLSQHIDVQRAHLNDQLAALAHTGDAAATRLETIGRALAGEIERADAHAHRLADAAEMAHASVAELLAAIPAARADSEEIGRRIDQAGLSAAAQVAALDAQLSTLADRAHEADVVATTAAERLAANIARISEASDGVGLRLDRAGATMATTVEALIARTEQSVEQARAGLGAEGEALVAALATHQAQLDSGARETAAAIARQAQAMADAADQARATLDAQGEMMIATLRAHQEALDATARAGAERLEQQADRVDTRLREAHGALGTQGEALLATLGTHQAALDASARDGAALLAGQIDAIEGRLEQARATLEVIGEAGTQALAERLEAIDRAVDHIAGRFEGQAGAGDTMIAGLHAAIESVEQRMAALQDQGEQRSQRLAASISALGGSADAMTEALKAGEAMATRTIGTTETLLVALDAAAREIDETLPEALDRLDGRIGASRSVVAQAKPELLALVTAAESTHDAIESIADVIATQRRTLDELGTGLSATLGQGRDQLAALDQSVAATLDRTQRFAGEAAPQLLDALERVRDTAELAAERAREALTAVIPQAAATMGDAATEAMRRATGDTVVRQVDAIADATRVAVEAATQATERLAAQVDTIATQSALVETRIGEARQERETAEKDMLTRRVATLIERLNSASIDITRAFAPDIADSAWAAYLKGDRGVFTRRAVRLLDASQAAAVVELYDGDAGFRDQVNRYIHDFEAMLRMILAQAEGSPLGVTLLSSDMGKLYVALAQAIERLR